MCEEYLLFIQHDSHTHRQVKSCGYMDRQAEQRGWG
jgi:hypothetical protein